MRVQTENIGERGNKPIAVLLPCAALVGYFGDELKHFALLACLCIKQN